MSLRHARITAALTALLVTVASSAGAAVLWDQSGLSSTAPAMVNAVAGGFGGFVEYSVNDVTVGAGGWTVNTITEYFSDWNPDWASATAGYLIVAPKTGPLPTAAPTLTSVPVSFVDDGAGVFVMTCSGLSLNLAPGDYWIGVTPIASAGIWGANLQWPSTTTVGDAIATYDTGWSNLYPGYDGAFKVEGVAGGATPTAQGSWGAIKALYR